MCNLYKKDEMAAKTQLREMQIKFQDAELKHRFEVEEISRSYENKLADAKSTLAKAHKE
jgi:hypothetical protein